MKTGLVLAAAIIIIRIILEQLGTSESINMVFGVVWLYLAFPVLFALRIAASGAAGGFKKLVKALFFFALYTRLMVAVTYILAYFFQWQAQRFSADAGGTVGPDVTPLVGILAVPALNALIWVVFATVVGMIIGGITLLIKKKAGGAPQ
jgi:hypothetical protein